jgi:hypothetical protein
MPKARALGVWNATCAPDLDIGDFRSPSIISHFHGGNRGFRTLAVHRKNLRWLGHVIAIKLSERHARELKTCFGGRAFLLKSDAGANRPNANALLYQEAPGLSP